MGRGRRPSLHLFCKTMSERAHFRGFRGSEREDFTAGPIPPLQPGDEMAPFERQRRVHACETPRVGRESACHAYPEIRKDREMRAPDWNVRPKNCFEFGVESRPRVKPFHKSTDALSFAESFIKCDSARSGQRIRRNDETVVVQWT